jgi:hypothetical protein
MSFDLSARKVGGAAAHTAPREYSEEEVAEHLRDYTLIPPDYWGKLRLGTYVRYVGKDGRLRLGGFITKNEPGVRLDLQSRPLKERDPNMLNWQMVYAQTARLYVKVTPEVEMLMDRLASLEEDQKKLAEKTNRNFEMIAEKIRSLLS